MKRRPEIAVLGLALGLILGIGVAGCGGGNGKRPTLYRGGDAPISRAADGAMIAIPAGTYVRGSTEREREEAYRDYQRTAGHDGARRAKWFEREPEARRVAAEAFLFDLTPVTNAAYAEFLRDTGRKPPAMDEATWRRQGYIQTWPDEVERYVWDGVDPPVERADHPVVLITWKEARDYCRWRGELVGKRRRLPGAGEFEKAARGPRGNIYPWGPDYDASKLNSAVAGPRDTVAVGSYPAGASPYGALDVAGNVFHWTRTRWRGKPTHYTVKGSAWDDFGGLGRGAALHGRPRDIRHVIVGFRCAG